MKKQKNFKQTKDINLKLNLMIGKIKFRTNIGKNVNKTK